LVFNIIFLVMFVMYDRGELHNFISRGVSIQLGQNQHHYKKFKILNLRMIPQLLMPFQTSLPSLRTCNSTIKLPLLAHFVGDARNC
jgi:hypothetical protein